MKSKVQEKQKSIEMRRKGASYKEILEHVDVSKSTLSNWLKDLPLTEDEKDVLKKRTDSNISRGRIKAASANRQNRLIREQLEFTEAQKEFDKYKDDPMFIAGVALYWAEGAKRSSNFRFINSDPDMICFMVLWIKRYMYVNEENMKCRLYLHAPYAHEEWETYWSELTHIPSSRFQKSIYKPSGLKVKKRPNYKGCLVVELSGVRFLWRMKFFQSMLVASSRKKL